ncbi:MAG: cytochrome c oxidase assembly protein [Gemmatimonadaceae bacterium]|nr:cytochrome c oxidase assembly protein [Gemmatimonadaceae bacterium]
MAVSTRDLAVRIERGARQGAPFRFPLNSHRETAQLSLRSGLDSPPHRLNSDSHCAGLPTRRPPLDFGYVAAPSRRPPLAFRVLGPPEYGHRRRALRRRLHLARETGSLGRRPRAGHRARGHAKGGSAGHGCGPAGPHARPVVVVFLITCAPLPHAERATARPFAIFNVVLAFWHLPPLYNVALANHGIHILQHLMFIAASVLMWWPLMSPLPELPRAAYPAQMLYCFLMVIPMSIISIYIAMADTLLYPAYAAAPRILGITPMQDQQYGGLIMWIPGGVFFYAVMTVVFFKWSNRGEDTEESAQVGWVPRAST